MSDSEHSTVTYTSLSEDDLYMGSPGVEVLIYEAPPSPDYVPGPEEPEQAPPSITYQVPYVPSLLPGVLTACSFVLFSCERRDRILHGCLIGGPGLCLYAPLRRNSKPPSPHPPYSSTTSPYTLPPLPIPHPLALLIVEGSLGSRALGSIDEDALPSHVHDTEIPEMWLPLRKRLCRTAPGPGYEVGESSAAGTARRVGPTTARADLYGFADTLEAAPGRPMSRELGYGIRDTWDDLVGATKREWHDHPRGGSPESYELARVNMLESDSPFHRRTAVLMEEEARLSRAAWAQSMDVCDQTHSEGILLRTTVMTQQSEIVELRAADQRRQTVISELLKADYRRQRQLVETLKIVKSLKAQMIEIQRQQGPAKDPAEPELPEEAGSST
ncbi:hypothetical protein Tco_0008737 [Tanacetum coccineum]